MNTPAVPTSESSAPTPHCSWCDKSQNAVAVIVATPTERARAYICDECVAVCNHIIEEHRKESKLPAVYETKMAIDWRALDKEVGGCWGTEPGIRVLELIVGEENIRGAVDHWITLEPGYGAAEQVLLIMRSKVAMEYCYEIYKKEPNTERAGRAIFLLSELADWNFIRWARELMEDSNTRWNALVALEQVLAGPLDDDGIDLAKELLLQAESDSDSRLRERAAEIHKRLAADPSLKHLGL